MIVIIITLHKCVYVQVNWPVRSGNMGSTTRTKRQSSQPIRILPYYVTANISSVGILNMLQANDGPVAYTLNYFQRTLSVIPLQENLRAPANSMCGPHVAVPDDHSEPSGTGVPNADYLYYITAVNDGIFMHIPYSGFYLRGPNFCKESRANKF